MCYYQKEFKINYSNSSARDFHLHVIFMSGHENTMIPCPPSLIPLFTSGLSVSVHGVWVLPLVKTNVKTWAGTWMGLDKALFFKSVPTRDTNGHPQVSFRVLIPKAWDAVIKAT